MQVTEDHIYFLTDEDNVRVMGGYGYQAPRYKQKEERTYTVNGLSVLVKAVRLTPAQPVQNCNLHLPSGKYLLTRTLVGTGKRQRVKVEVSKHG